MPMTTKPDEELTVAELQELLAEVLKPIVVKPIILEKDLELLPPYVFRGADLNKLDKDLAAISNGTYDKTIEIDNSVDDKWDNDIWGNIVDNITEE
jgi:hypothetical protein